MQDSEFDATLIGHAFTQAGERGWARLSVVTAARDAGLPLGRARLRFPGTTAVLQRFGRMADAATFEGAAATGPVRDRIFDMVMRRIDVLQAHRAGMLALLRWLPLHPLTGAMLAVSNLRSAGWMLEAAGLSAAGPTGLLRAEGMLAVWLWTVRAWRDDESPDLSATMAALDRALDRAEQADAELARFIRPSASVGADASPGSPAEPDFTASDLPDPPPDASGELFPPADTVPPIPPVLPSNSPGDRHAE